MTKNTKTTWRKMKLGEVADVLNGYAFSSRAFVPKDDKAMPVFKMGNIREGGGIQWTGKEDYIPENQARDLMRFSTEPGDILMCMTDMKANVRLLGYSAYIKNEKFLVNQRVGRIKAKKDLADSRFLFYYLNSPSYISYIRSTARSGVQVNLSTEEIRESPLLIPEYADQKHIADVLSAFDEKIEVNNKISQTLEQMAQAIFKEWFVKNQKSKIKNKKLGDLVKIVSGYPFSSKLYTTNKKALGVVTIKNVQDGNFVTSCDSFINKEDIPKNMSPECSISDGDILLSLTGNVGRVCFVYGGEYLLNQRVAKIKPKNGKDFAFCYFLFRQPAMQNQLINMAKGSAQPNLSPVETGEIMLIIPSREILDKFNALASPIYKRLVQNAVENQKLAALRDLLLPKLMSGEVRV